LATAIRGAGRPFPEGFAGCFAEAGPREAGRVFAGTAGIRFATFFTDDFAASFFDIGRPSPRSWQQKSSERSEPGTRLPLTNKPAKEPARTLICGTFTSKASPFYLITWLHLNESSAPLL
jgi:hypothetical protein